MKKVIIAFACLLVVAGAGGGYVLKHNADVEHARQERAKERQERADRAYRQRVSQWQADMDHWRSENDDYEACKSNTADAFSAMDDISGKITGGLNYDEYSNAVAEVATAVTRAIREGKGTCLTVTLSLATASDQYGSAAEIWRKWYNDPVGSIDDLDLDPHWNKASTASTEAQSALADLEPGPAPVKPTRQAPGSSSQTHAA
jgi:hypothetical protein